MLPGEHVSRAKIACCDGGEDIVTQTGTSRTPALAEDLCRHVELQVLRLYTASVKAAFESCLPLSFVINGQYNDESAAPEHHGRLP